MTAPCLAAALAYAAHGWPVVPLHGPERPVEHPGKRPWLPDWTNTATTDYPTIRRWWAERPDSNVGIVTGPRSGLAVLDIDPRSGGTDSLAALEGRVGVLPGTVQNLTGGGLHLLYAHPGCKVTSRAHSLGRGLDVKADGGQIVAPPSIHPETGRTYAWLGGVWDHGIADWPAALLPPQAVPEARPTSLRPVVYDDGAGHVERRLAGVVQVVIDAQEGERNRRLHWAACRCAEMVVAGQMPDQMGLDALLLAGQAVGLPTAEALATIRSGLRGAVAA